MLAGMIFLKDTMFHGKDNDDQLVKIAEVLGTDELHAYLRKYGLVLGPQYEESLGKAKMPRQPWSNFINQSNEHLALPEAIDLLDRLLRYDHQERPTAQEAMQHRYFDPVRSAENKMTD